MWMCWPIMCSCPMNTTLHSQYTTLYRICRETIEKHTKTTEAGEEIGHKTDQPLTIKILEHVYSYLSCELTVPNNNQKVGPKVDQRSTWTGISEKTQFISKSAGKQQEQDSQQHRQCHRSLIQPIQSQDITKHKHFSKCSTTLSFVKWSGLSKALWEELPWSCSWHRDRKNSFRLEMPFEAHGW